ncbi:hypothetical protein Q0Z83_058030 [Actinoplanes sichuanensis]|nr:hypothetical protein Q0Z83_058030 [Actinoplanes sichuanensis]
MPSIVAQNHPIRPLWTALSTAAGTVRAERWILSGWSSPLSRASHEPDNERQRCYIDGKAVVTADPLPSAS